MAKQMTRFLLDRTRGGVPFVTRRSCTAAARIDRSMQHREHERSLFEWPAVVGSIAPCQVVAVSGVGFDGVGVVLVRPVWCMWWSWWSTRHWQERRSYCAGLLVRS